MNERLITGAAIAFASLCLGATANTSSYNPESEQFQKPGWQVPGTALAIGGVVGGFNLIQRSLKEESQSKPTTTTQSFQKKESSLPVETITQTYASSAQSINTDFTEDEFEIEEEKEPVKSQSLVNQAAKYITNKLGCGILISCITGSGKTTFLYSFFSKIHEICDGHLHIGIVDGKGSLWGGLEDLKEVDGRPRVVITGDKVGTEKENAVLEAVHKILFYESLRAGRAKQRREAQKAGKPYNPSPIILLLEEWLAFKASLPKDLKAQVLEVVNSLFFTGREDGVFVVVTTQGHACGLTEFNTGTRENVMLMGISPINDSRSVTSLIEDSWVIKSKKTREDLTEKLAQLVQGSSNESRVFFSSMGNELGLMPMLNYHEERAKFERIFATNNVVQFRAKTQASSDELTKDLWG